MIGAFRVSNGAPQAAQNRELPSRGEPQEWQGGPTSGLPGDSAMTASMTSVEWSSAGRLAFGVRFMVLGLDASEVPAGDSDPMGGARLLLWHANNFAPRRVMPSLADGWLHVAAIH